MHTRGRRHVAQSIALAAALLLPTLSPAQPGFYAIPSVSVAEVFDDNLFFTSSKRESDFISRFSPEIQAGYRSAPFTILGRYLLEAEVFVRHSELNDPVARQLASLDVQYLPSPLLTLSGAMGYVDSTTPGELTAETGLEFRRERVRRFLVSSGLGYRFDPLSTATASYAFTTDESDDLVTDTHVVNLGLDRRLTERDTGLVGYTGGHYSFDGDEITSHAVTLGWTRQVTPRTGFTLRAGPRFTDGSVDPEAAVSILHRWSRGEAVLAYARTLTTVVGERGTLETDSVSVLVSYRVTPALRMSGGPSFATSRGAIDADVYRATVEVTYQLTKWLALTTSYHLSLQRRRLEPEPGSTRRREEEIPHNVLLLRITATRPVRVD